MTPHGLSLLPAKMSDVLLGHTRGRIAAARRGDRIFLMCHSMAWSAE